MPRVHRLPAVMLAFTIAPLALAEEVVVRNDSVEDEDSIAIQIGFIAEESGAAWLTSPCDGNIVAVQIFWASLLGNGAPVLHDSITIFAAGDFPQPGPVLEELVGPVMIDGRLNEFRYLDENQQIPLGVPIATGETFVVSFKFASTPPLLGPSLVTDIDGCQDLKNAVFAVPQQWIDPCALGMSGDFFIRAVVDCGVCPEDLDDDGMVGFNDILRILDAWGPCPDCPEDLNGDDAVDFDDLLRVLTAWGDC